MRKQQWAKSGNGPDWTDIEVALRAIDATHLGKTGVLISPLGTGGNGGLALVISTVWDSVAAPSGMEAVDSQSHWPCAEGCTLEGHILAGIYKHDFAIGEAYQQRSFMEA